MKYRISIPLRIRVLLSAALTALAFLFLGAARIQDSIRTRQTEQETAKQSCRDIVSAWHRAIPERDRSAWNDLADRAPELCLRSLCLPAHASGTETR